MSNVDQNLNYPYTLSKSDYEIFMKQFDEIGLIEFEDEDDNVVLKNIEILKSFLQKKDIDVKMKLYVEAFLKDLQTCVQDC